MCREYSVPFGFGEKIDGHITIKKNDSTISIVDIDEKAESKTMQFPQKEIEELLDRLLQDNVILAPDAAMAITMKHLFNALSQIRLSSVTHDIREEFENKIKRIIYDLI